MYMYMEIHVHVHTMHIQCTCTCTQVLVGHSKAEVFEMVRDLNLPVEQGDIHLLKKLQALGLHANRSPPPPTPPHTHTHTHTRTLQLSTLSEKSLILC